MRSPINVRNLNGSTDRLRDLPGYAGMATHLIPEAAPWLPAGARAAFLHHAEELAGLAEDDRIVLRWLTSADCPFDQRQRVATATALEWLAGSYLQPLVLELLPITATKRTLQLVEVAAVRLAALSDPAHATLTALVEGGATVTELPQVLTDDCRKVNGRYEVDLPGSARIAPRSASLAKWATRQIDAHLDNLAAQSKRGLVYNPGKRGIRVSPNRQAASVQMGVNAVIQNVWLHLDRSVSAASITNTAALHVLETAGPFAAANMLGASKPGRVLDRLAKADAWRADVAVH